jgi:hypothetical protein
MKNRHLYPEDWEKISLELRQQYNWQCQCCGKHCRRSGESIKNFIERTGASEAEVVAHPIRWCLTIAHLNHEPSDCRHENLTAMCAPCHLRNDAKRHAQSRKINRRKAQEAQGQLILFEDCY